MSEIAISKVRDLENIMLELPQEILPVHHTLHGGIYTRTVLIPAGTIITGAHIKIPTTLIVSGNVSLYTGVDIVQLDGYFVLEAKADRKSAFLAHTDTYLTMMFPTQAQTIEEAENEFTDEADSLQSRSTKEN